MQNYQRIKKGKKNNPAKTNGWKTAYEDGKAEEFANYIIQTRPIPVGLLRAILKAE